MEHDLTRKPRVGLFVTCVVDLMRPSVVSPPLSSSRMRAASSRCRCRPAAASRPTIPATVAPPAESPNVRSRSSAVTITWSAPSGSCAGMIKAHYPELFADDPNWLPRASELAARTYELTSFLVDVLGVTRVEAAFDGAVTYHDSCSGLRELGIRNQPRKLLASVEGLTLVEMDDSDVCCGFGGTFAVKYSDISGAIVEAKARDMSRTGAPTLLAGDLGCLLNMAGKLSRDGSPVHVRHVAEVLAGMTDEPPIGMPKDHVR